MLRTPNNRRPQVLGSRTDYQGLRDTPCSVDVCEEACGVSAIRKIAAPHAMNEPMASRNRYGHTVRSPIPK